MNISILNELLTIILTFAVVTAPTDQDISYQDIVYQDTTYINEYGYEYNLQNNYEYTGNYSHETDLLSTFTLTEPEIHTFTSTEIEWANPRMGALDWFSEVQYLFPRDSDATVIDIDTGKSFRIRRTFGRHHADIEPLTKEDSRIIKEVWGGTWNWQRRAVIVKPDVGGHVIAGSMTGYPHAGLDRYPALINVDNRSGGFGTGQNLDVIKGNGVDGHFDIHFLNSRTHGTNVMQQEHQNVVQRAAVYISENF